MSLVYRICRRPEVPMCGRILRRIPAAGFRIGHTQRRAATVRPFCSRGEAWSALTECSTESASGPGPSAAMCILQRPVQNVAEEWPFRPRVPASAALRLRSGRDPPSREAVTVLVARTRLGSSGRLLPALQRTGQFGAVQVGLRMETPGRAGACQGQAGCRWRRELDVQPCYHFAFAFAG